MLINVLFLNLLFKLGKLRFIVQEAMQIAQGYFEAWSFEHGKTKSL